VILWKAIQPQDGLQVGRHNGNRQLIDAANGNQIDQGTGFGCRLIADQIIHPAQV